MGSWVKGKQGRPPIKHSKTSRNRMVVVNVNRAEEQLLEDLTTWENNARIAQGMEGKLKPKDLLLALFFKRAEECGLLNFKEEGGGEEEEPEEEAPPESDDTLDMLEKDPEPPKPRSDPKPPEKPDDTP